MQHIKMPRNDEKNIYAPQIMFNSGGTLRIIFIFLTQIVKGLRKYTDRFLIYDLRVKLARPGPNYE